MLFDLASALSASSIVIFREVVRGCVSQKSRPFAALQTHLDKRKLFSYGYCNQYMTMSLKLSLVNRIEGIIHNSLTFQLSNGFI